MPVNSTRLALGAKLICIGWLLAACDSSNLSKLGPANPDLSNELEGLLEQHSANQGLLAFALPASDDYSNIPQDPSNPLTDRKVALGQLLFHETAVGTETTDHARTMNYSCATCHHAAAGFKSGVPQGVGDGGIGFGNNGSARLLADEMDPGADADSRFNPDIQPVTSPTILNSAYQSVMLWNGSFGGDQASPNQLVADMENAGPPGMAVNTFGLSGLETQVLAGTKVHRMRFDADSVLQSHPAYAQMYAEAFPEQLTGYIPDNGTTVSAEALGAAKAIAAFERTVLANEAPFQRWLRGDRSAMNAQQLRGAMLFFGKADCVSCHTGPALSSPVNASEEDIFHAVGFADFNTDDPRVHGEVDEKTRLGRGGFTGRAEDNYKFKIPPLYNLKDTIVFGHGASFSRVRDIVAYKNLAIAQNPDSVNNLSEKFVPLMLSEDEIDDLTVFLEDALYDPDLDRYVPASLPTGSCFPASDFQSALDLGCLADPDISDLPFCKHEESDPDGDGLGWEYGGSCRLADNK